MQARILFTTLSLTMVLTGCSYIEKPVPPDNEFKPDDRDAIPVVVPLPNPEVNQRPQLGTKTMLVTVTHWQDGGGLNFELIKKHTLSSDPDSLQSYISAASGGKMALAGQVIQHTSGPRPEVCKQGTPYPIELAAEEGHKTARAHGLDADKFDYFISVIDCGGAGSARMPGRFMGIYGQSGSPHIYKHEFGHNLGYDHGSTHIRCSKFTDTVNATTGCETIFLGDTGDSVSGGATLYPANNRWYSGWLSSSQAPVISTPGLYRLEKLGGWGPQLYLVNRPGLTPAQLALEIRKPTPFDNFPQYDNRVTGVWIRYTTMATKLINTQLDATPQTATTLDPTLQLGQTFKDDTGTLIRVCGADDAGATVAVSFNSQPLPTCTPSLTAPAFTYPRSGEQVGYRPIVSGTGMPGTSVELIRVANGHDRYEMGQAAVGPDGKWTTQLTQPLPSGLNMLVAFSRNSGSSPSTDTRSAQFTVVATPDRPDFHTPPANATTGPYPVFSGTGLPGATVVVERVRDGIMVGVVATALVGEDGNWSAQSVVEFMPGTNTVGAKQWNADKPSPNRGGPTFIVAQ